MIRAIVTRLAALLPERVIFDRDGGSPYLSRYYLIGRPRMPDGSDPFEADGAPKAGAIIPEGIGLYLHRFHQSDADDALHNHPWEWAWSLILAGGYLEERANGEAPTGHPRVSRAVYVPGDVVRISHDTFHRVELLERDAWTLFVAGPKTKSWSFWDRATGRRTPWREWIERRRANTARAS